VQKKGFKGKVSTQSKVLSPKMLKKTTLLSLGEYKVIKTLLKPIWKSLDILKQDWFSLTTTQSYVSLKETMVRILGKRYSLIEAIRRLTTSRLREIRTLKKDAKLRKAQVTLEDLKQLITARGEAKGKIFLKELLTVFEDEYMKSVLSDEPEKVLNTTLASDYFGTSGIPSNKFSNGIDLMLRTINYFTSINNAIDRLDSLTNSVNKYVTLPSNKRELFTNEGSNIINHVKDIKEHISKLNAGYTNYASNLAGSHHFLTKTEAFEVVDRVIERFQSTLLKHNPISVPVVEPKSVRKKWT